MHMMYRTWNIMKYTYLVQGHNEEGEGEGKDHKPPLPVQVRSRHTVISDEM